MDQPTTQPGPAFTEAVVGGQRMSLYVCGPECPHGPSNQPTPCRYCHEDAFYERAAVALLIKNRLSVPRNHGWLAAALKDQVDAVGYSVMFLGEKVKRAETQVHGLIDEVARAGAIVRRLERRLWWPRLRRALRLWAAGTSGPEAWRAALEGWDARPTDPPGVVRTPDDRPHRPWGDGWSN